jgi:hypothetical protein
MNRLLILVVTIAACGSRSNPPPASNTTPTAASCAERAAELKLYLGSVYDPSAKPAAPWPTGDADTDRTITELRDKVRKASAPADPSARAPRLEAGVKPGRLELELATCPAAKDSLARVGTAESEPQKRAGWVGVADGIGQCGCALNVPLVRALMYMLVRGAD